MIQVSQVCLATLICQLITLVSLESAASTLGSQPSSASKHEITSPRPVPTLKTLTGQRQAIESSSQNSSPNHQQQHDDELPSDFEPQANKEKNFAEAIFTKLLPALILARQNEVQQQQQQQQQQLSTNTMEKIQPSDSEFSQPSTPLIGPNADPNTVTDSLEFSPTSHLTPSYNYNYNFNHAVPSRQMMTIGDTQSQDSNFDSNSASALRPSISAISNNLYYPSNEQTLSSISHRHNQQQPLSLQSSHWQPNSPAQVHWYPAQHSRPILVHLPTISPQASAVSTTSRPAVGPQQQQQPSQGIGSNLLAFLANNRANLSHLIQLLPLLAQTIATLPRVIHPTVAGPRLRPSSELSSSIAQLSSNQTLNGDRSISERLGQLQQQQQQQQLQHHSNGLQLVSDIVGRLWSKQLPSQQRPGTNYELLTSTGGDSSTIGTPSSAAALIRLLFSSLSGSNGSRIGHWSRLLQTQSIEPV